MANFVRTILLFPLLFLRVGSLQAQDRFLDEWRSTRSANPSQVAFSISVAKTTFYLGEAIPLELTFTSTQPSEFAVEQRLQDRIGRVNGEDEFRITGDGATEDPLRGLQGENGGFGGLSAGPALLSDKPRTLKLALNEWVRLREPGTYRLYVLTRRVARVQQPLPAPPIFPRLGSQLEIASNVLTIEVLPAPDDWVKQQIAVSMAILDAPENPNSDDYQKRVDAGRVLVFLNTRESAFELARRISDIRDVNSFLLHMAVLGSPYRSELLPFLEKRLIAPDQPVWDRYLETIAHMAELIASQGPIAPVPKDEAGRPAYLQE